jgi:hypothetical protein
VRNCGGGPQDILEVGDSYLSISDRTQRSKFPEKVTSSYLSLECRVTAGKCLIRDRDGRVLRNPTPVIEVRGLEDDPGQKKVVTRHTRDDQLMNIILSAWPRSPQERL